MSGTIRTYQKCLRCGEKFGTSNGLNGPIFCKNGCGTQPTKYFIRIKGKNHFNDKKGNTLHYYPAAVALLGGIRDEIYRGVYDPDAYRKQSKTTFEAFWKRFQGQYRGGVGTYDKLRAISNHLKFYHDMQVKEIRAFHIADWWSELRESGLSPHYRNDILQWLTRFFRVAYAEEIIEEMPRRFPEPESLPEPEVTEYLTLNEQLKVLDALPDLDRPIFDFLFLTGCRVNEACALQRPDINWNTGRVFLNNTVKRDGSIGVVKNKKRRVIPISHDLDKCLKKALKRENFDRFIFINKWGRRYSDDYLRDTFNDTCLNTIGWKIKLKNATRHSLGMRLAELGYTMDEIREILNQSNTRVTKHYVTMQDDRHKEVYERGDNSLTRKKETS